MISYPALFSNDGGKRMTLRSGRSLAVLALTAVLMVMQSRLTGVTVNHQLRICWPALRATVWASAAYAGIMFLPSSDLVRTLAASGGFLVSYGLVLFLIHRPTLESYLRQAKSLLWRGPVTE